MTARPCKRCGETKSIEEFRQATKVKPSGYVWHGRRAVCTGCETVSRRGRKHGVRTKEQRQAERRRAAERRGKSYRTSQEIAALPRAALPQPLTQGMQSREKTLDHIQPVSSGGHHTRTNVVVCCRTCNYDKGDQTLDEWRPPGLSVGVLTRGQTHATA